MGLFAKKPPLAPSTPIIPPQWNPFSANVFEAKRLPSPGSGNYAYENLGLFEQTFIGPGVANRQFIKPLQPPQLYQYQSVMVSGLGGVSAGQIIGQPLVNPYGDQPIEGSQ